MPFSANNFERVAENKRTLERWQGRAVIVMQVTNPATLANHQKTMNIQELTEKVARCIRAIGKEPAALLFIDGNNDWTCDAEEVLGIPVLHGIDLKCFRWECDDLDCPIIPLGKNDGQINFRDRKRFSEAWSESN